jgi:hypothetical protein
MKLSEIEHISIGQKLDEEFQVVITGSNASLKKGKFKNCTCLYTIASALCLRIIFFPEFWHIAFRQRRVL